MSMNASPQPVVPRLGELSGEICRGGNSRLGYVWFPVPTRSEMPEKQRKFEGPLHERLTRREREILGVLADDLTVPEIAEKLMVAPSSVKSHLKHLYNAIYEL